jgi:penicillin-binding protein-related factor A (putative recombinase)
MLNRVHDGYEAQGRASIVKNPHPMKVLAGCQLLTYEVRRGPTKRSIRGMAYPAVNAAEGPPDYSVQASGRNFLLDAKDCAQTRWPFANLEEHQARRFDAHEAQLGRAFVLLHLEDVAYLLPWRHHHPVPMLRDLWWAHHEVEGRAAAGTASIDPETCARIGFRLRSPDWLPSALSLPPLGPCGVKPICFRPPPILQPAPKKRRAPARPKAPADTLVVPEWAR